MVLSQGYFPGMPLGIREKDMTYLPLPTFSSLFGLGYHPNKGEMTLRNRQMRMERMISENGQEPKRPILQTISGDVERYVCTRG